MTKKFSRILAAFLSIALLVSCMIPVFAAEVAEDEKPGLFNPKLSIKIETDEKIYGTSDEIVFKVTVKNIGLVKAERVYVETKSHHHIDLDDDQKYVIVGDLEVGEEKTVEVYGRYKDPSNTNIMTRLFLRMFTSLHEFMFSLYANILAPMFNDANMSYCEVNIYDNYEGIDNDYGVLVFVKYGHLPGEVVTTTTEPATEEGATDAPFEEATDAEVTDDFEVAPSDYPEAE